MDSNTKFTEDTSWGCAIRSCQMMYSVLITKICENSNQYKNKLSTLDKLEKLKANQKLREDILKLFLDHESKPFSIQQHS